MTREPVLPYLTRVTVAPITGTIKGLGSEVPVGPSNGLEQESVTSCDNVTTISRSDLGRQIGYPRTEQEDELHAALAYAFSLLGRDPATTVWVLSTGTGIVGSVQARDVGAKEHAWG